MGEGGVVFGASRLVFFFGDATAAVVVGHRAGSVDGLGVMCHVSCVEILLLSGVGMVSEKTVCCKTSDLISET